MVKET